MKCKWNLIISFLSVACVSYSCATGGDDSSKKSEIKPEASSRKSTRKSSGSSGSSISVSGATSPFVNSLSNSSMVADPVSRSKAKTMAARIESRVKAAKVIRAEDVVAVMAAKRLSGAGYASVMSSAKKLMNQELKKSIDKDLPSIAKLEIAIAAFQERKYGMAEYYIIQLKDAKIAAIKSAAFTLEGLLFYKFSTPLNAIASWQEALKLDSSNRAARLNIALIALAHGDYKNANKYLTATKQDWFVSGLLASSEKYALKGKKAQALCNKAVGEKPKNRQLLYNCALVDYQVNQDYAGATSKLNKANSMAGGPPELGEKIVAALRDVKTVKAKANKPKAPSNKSKKEGEDSKSK